MSSDLKPCPMCGSAARISMSDDRREQPFVYIIGCSQCPISMDWQKTEAEAIAAWNTRPDEIERLSTPTDVADRREAAKQALRRWHRDTCYPDALDGELDIGLDAIASLIAGPLPEGFVVMPRYIYRAMLAARPTGDA